MHDTKNTLQCIAEDGLDTPVCAPLPCVQHGGVPGRGSHGRGQDALPQTVRQVQDVQVISTN